MVFECDWGVARLRSISIEINFVPLSTQQKHILFVSWGLAIRRVRIADIQKELFKCWWWRRLRCTTYIATDVFAEMSTHANHSEMQQQKNYEQFKFDTHPNSPAHTQAVWSLWNCDGRFWGWNQFECISNYDMHCAHRSPPSESTCSMTMPMRQIVINEICFCSRISPDRASGHSWRQIENSLQQNLLSHSIHLYVPKPICGLMIETHTEMIHVCLCTVHPSHDMINF